MGELMGTLRPVKQRIENHGQAEKYQVEPLGDVTTGLRYKQAEDSGIMEVLDEVRLPFVDGAFGHGLYDQAGNLLTVWEIFAVTPGEELRISAGWGFKARAIAGETAQTAQRATANA
jgi:hypothetical protein